MIDVILDAVYDRYLRKDDPELLQKKDVTLKKILEMSELEELAVDDALLDLCSTYEDRAFRSGFMAAIDCMNALIGGSHRL